ncbi:peptide deformylase [Streptomyces sp. SID11385]|uniref:peptide deformylase n=1 Tax=Streptomyces sp. SID11385 TaxID=2706031 RepID=UPI0013C558C8|nr:peptide deformylase [Streptomyces sp. SID11385]NEA43475.1 peptide deformylase [Streptomyces sp. SID11385]
MTEPAAAPARSLAPPPDSVRARIPAGVPVYVLGERYEGEYPPLAPEAARGRMLRVTEVGEEVLARRCAEATEFGTPGLARLIDDMFLTMYLSEGAGLAANQVGVDLRLFVYDCFDDEGARHVGHVLNPVIDEAASGRTLIDDVEGCLSVPGAQHELARADRTVVHGVDRQGRPVTIEGSGYFARCLQHETDHLNGMVYVDRLAQRARRAVLTDMAEARGTVLAERRARAAAMGVEDLSEER